MRKHLLCAALLACAGASLTTPAFAAQSGGAQEYVVAYADSASALAGRQAVEAAGGTVVAENAAIKTATVRSSDPSFIEKVTRQSAIDGATLDSAIGQTPSDRPKDDQPENLQGAHGPGPAPAPTMDAPAPVQGDPLGPLQWDMQMIDATPDGSYARQQASHAVRVGIIDTGIDGSHPDIAPNFDRQLSRNFTTDQPTIDGPCEHPSCVDPNDEDDDGHGTHTAGTVGAALNGIGIAGIAPKVDLVNLRAGQDSGFFFVNEVANALTYAGDSGVDVVNMSFFIDPWLYNCRNNPFDTPEQQQEQRTIIKITNRALGYARSHGVTMVAALGNENTDAGHPTIDHTSPDIQPGFIPQPPDFDPNRPVDNSCLDLPAEGRHGDHAGPLGPSGRKAYYSNWGIEQADVSAPGGDIRDFFGTDRYFQPENLVLSPYPLNVARANCEVDANGAPNGLTGCPPDTPAERFPPLVQDCANGVCALYQWAQGTSMASPHAVGVAALAVAQFGKADKKLGGVTLDPGKTEQLVRRGATDTPCPAQNPFVYPDRPASFNALCEGDARQNGFYGDGVVNAVGVLSDGHGGHGGHGR